MIKVIVSPRSSVLHQSYSYYGEKIFTRHVKQIFRIVKLLVHIYKEPGPTWVKWVQFCQIQIRRVIDDKKRDKLYLADWITISFLQWTSLKNFRTNTSKVDYSIMRYTDSFTSL